MKNEMNEKNLNAVVELPDESAEKVAGGGWCNSLSGYKSGSTPRFHVGETVYSSADFLPANTVGNVAYYRGVVASVSDTADGGWINKEFTYTVDWNAKGVYELSTFSVASTVIAWQAYSNHETNVYESYLASRQGEYSSAYNPS